MRCWKKKKQNISNPHYQLKDKEGYMNKEKLQYTAKSYNRIHTAYSRQREREKEIKKRAFGIKEALQKLFRILTQIK